MCVHIDRFNAGKVVQNISELIFTFLFNCVSNVEFELVLKYRKTKSDEERVKELSPALSAFSFNYF